MSACFFFASESILHRLVALFIYGTLDTSYGQLGRRKKENKHWKFETLRNATRSHALILWRSGPRIRDLDPSTVLAMSTNPLPKDEDLPLGLDVDAVCPTCCCLHICCWIPTGSFSNHCCLTWWLDFKGQSWGLFFTSRQHVYCQVRNVPTA